MTTNQVNYAKHLEQARANRAQEEIGRQTASAQTTQAWAAASQAQTASLRQAEDARHNVQQEAIGWATQQADAAYKRSTAAAQLSQASSAQQRVQTEAYWRSATLNETIRHDTAQEQETNRSNVAQETIGSRQAAAAELRSKAQVATAANQFAKTIMGFVSYGLGGTVYAP